jgi:hypothetical protein
MFSNLFELSVEVNGRNIPEFGHKGKTYVEGRKNHRYQIKFRNSRAERVLVVPTVDGLSVVDAQPYHGNSPGYVVQAYSSLTISGWRTSLSEVRGFEFSDKSGSFAGKTVGQQNCGVIGAMVYAEKQQVHWQDIHIHHHHFPPSPPPPVYPPYTIRYMSGTPERTYGSLCSPGVSTRESDLSGVSIMCCQAANSSPDFNLGTTYGAPIQDSVMNVSFEKGLCLATFEIYYSDREGLLKDGIQVDKSPELASFPQAFGGFCKLPV